MKLEDDANILDELSNENYHKSKNELYYYFLQLVSILTVCIYFIPIVSVVNFGEIEELLSLLSPNKENINQIETISFHNTFTKNYIYCKNYPHTVFRVFMLLELLLPVTLILSLFKRNNFLKRTIEITYLLITTLNLILLNISFFEISKFQTGFFLILFCCIVFIIDIIRPTGI